MKLKIILIIFLLSGCVKWQEVTPDEMEIKSGMKSLLVNAGGQGTTDWIDTDGNQAGDGWMSDNSGSTAYKYPVYFTSGNGFWRAQGIHGATMRPGFYNVDFKFIPGKKYFIEMRYRSSTELRIGLTTTYFPTNTDNAKKIKAVVTCPANYRFYLYSTTGGQDDWFEVDELNLFEL